MARPLRIQAAGGIFHLWQRGNRHQPIFLDDVDRERFLTLLMDVVRRYRWLVHGYVLMGNHYHLLVETPYEGTLAPGMQRLNGVYAQWFNRRHCLGGHLFQGRYHSKLIASDEQLATLVRYFAWNPVRAGICACPGDWQWSSLRRLVPSDRILGFFGHDRASANRRYRRFVLEAAPRPP